MNEWFIAVFVVVFVLFSSLHYKGIQTTAAFLVSRNLF